MRSGTHQDLVVGIRDLLDRNGMQRTLDENDDGMPEPDLVDRNHRFKLDLSLPTSSVEIDK